MVYSIHLMIITWVLQLRMLLEKYKISRDEQDNFSLNSQKKTEKAYSQNRFKDELIKLQIEDGNKKLIFEKDEHPRENLIIDDLKN